MIIADILNVHLCINGRIIVEGGVFIHPSLSTSEDSFATS